MRWLYQVRVILAGLTRRRSLDDQLQRDITFHLDQETAEGMANGLLESEARRRARASFGSIDAVREELRDRRRLPGLEQLVQDARYATRGLRRNPGLATVAILSLAIGIGANTAIFSMLYAITWRPLPVANPEALVRLRAFDRGTGKEVSLPAPVLRELRDQRQIFAGIAFDSSDGLAARIGDRTDRVIGEVVTADFFSVLGVRLFLGTDFPPDADGVAWEPLAIVSYDFFSRHFNADPGIVGRNIYLNGYAFRIIGVSPPAFSGLNIGQAADLRFPMMLESGMQAQRMPALTLLDQSARGFTPVGRLQPGVNRPQAEAATQAAVHHLWRAAGGPGEARSLLKNPT